MLFPFKEKIYLHIMENSIFKTFGNEKNNKCESTQNETHANLTCRPLDISLQVTDSLFWFFLSFPCSLIDSINLTVCVSHCFYLIRVVRWILIATASFQCTIIPTHVLEVPIEHYVDLRRHNTFMNLKQSLDHRYGKNMYEDNESYPRTLDLN